MIISRRINGTPISEEEFKDIVIVNDVMRDTLKEVRAQGNISIETNQTENELKHIS